jgi:hypothetical protein
VNRRELNTLLGGVAVGWPLGAMAQDGERTHHLGILWPLLPKGQIALAFFNELDGAVLMKAKTSPLIIGHTPRTLI